MRNQDKFNAFLQYTPLLYNYLSINTIEQFSSINSCLWLQGTKITKSSFKCIENYLCLAGEDVHHKNKGVLCTYYARIPKIQQLDDDRLNPSITLKSRYEFNSPITHIQQISNINPSSVYSNCLAISLKKSTDIFIMPTHITMSDRANNYQNQEFITLKGHSGSINRMFWANFKSSSYKLITASSDKTLIQWDLEKMRQQKQMKYHKDCVNDLTPLFNDDHTIWQEGPQIQTPQIIASASSDGYVFLWEQRQNNPINKINCKQKQLHSIVCTSKNGLITGGNNGSIKFWDLRHHREYSYQNTKDKIEGHKQQVSKIKLLRGIGEDIKESFNQHIGRINFVTGSKDGKIIIWQQKSQFVHQGHYDEISDFDYLRDSGYFVSASKNIPRIMIWQQGVTMGPLQK